MFWFDKHHPRALYIDHREELNGFIDNRPNRTIKPDELADFRDLPYKDGQFKLVVWDPPHLVRRPEGATGKYLVKIYGFLDRSTWQEDLRRGFDEC